MIPSRWLKGSMPCHLRKLEPIQRTCSGWLPEAVGLGGNLLFRGHRETSRSVYQFFAFFYGCFLLRALAFFVGVFTISLWPETSTCKLSCLVVVGGRLFVICSLLWVVYPSAHGWELQSAEATQDQMRCPLQRGNVYSGGHKIPSRDKLGDHQRTRAFSFLQHL